MRVFGLIVVLLAALAPDNALAQDMCETPVADLASCPPCPASPRCRRPRDDGFMPSFNGCGPQKFSKLIENGVIPQGYGDADFRNGGCTAPKTCGCNQHDICYGTCNAAKAACDDAFLNELLDECWRKYPATKDSCPDGLCFTNRDRLGICTSRARLYFRAVAGGGQSAYDDAQKEGCQCCGPANQAICECNHKCYPTGTACLAECKTQISVCNTGICRTAMPGECPP